eukprot:3301036-Alexandrium_andersonii.AAC.1
MLSEPGCHRPAGCGRAEAKAVGCCPGSRASTACCSRASGLGCVGVRVALGHCAGTVLVIIGGILDAHAGGRAHL